MSNSISAMRPQLGVIKATALLLGLSLCITAKAATEAPRQDAPRQHQDARRPMGMEPRLEELHKQLGLDDSQEALWKQAQDASEKLRQEMRQAHQARHEKLRQALEAKNPDLRALAAQMDQEREADQQKHKQVREAWFKLYDALDPAQKQKASRFLLGMVDMMDHHRDHRGMDHGMGPEGRRRGPGGEGSGAGGAMPQQR